MVEVKNIISNKKEFLDLLLLADEEEAMIDKYLERGEMFALYDSNLKGITVVTSEGDGIYEIKNLAIKETDQRKGYGKKLIDYILNHYKSRCKVMLVGTGDNTSNVLFYERCGFIKSHKVKNFFADNYTVPIFDDGFQLFDMIYLKIEFLT